MKNHYQRTIGKLWERIEELEAENARIENKFKKASSEIDYRTALLNASRAEIDRLCAMLGEADSRTTRPKGGDA